MGTADEGYGVMDDPFAVLGFYFRKTLPPNFGLRMITAVILTAFSGAIARHSIDNAAHAGGLLGGALVGWLLVSTQKTLPLRLPPLAQFAGRASLALVLAATLFIVLLMLRHV
jgi:membrane associated rhomboid family serine protease